MKIKKEREKYKYVIKERMYGNDKREKKNAAYVIGHKLDLIEMIAQNIINVIVATCNIMWLLKLDYFRFRSDFLENSK